MGILEHVSGLEDVASGGEERLKQKPKKAEAAKSDSQLNSRLEKIEDSVGNLEKMIEDIGGGARPSSESQPPSDAIEKLQSDIEALRETVGNLGKEKSGAGENNLHDILRRLDEMESAGNCGKDYSGEIEGLKSSIENLKSEMAASPAQGYGREELESMRRIAEKNSMEMKSRMDVLQKYVDGKLGSIDRIVGDSVARSEGSQKDIMPDVDRKINERLKMLVQSADFQKSSAANLDRLNEFSRKMDSIRNDTAKMVSDALRNVPKPDDIIRGVDERISARISEFSRKVDEFSRYDLDKLKSVADAEKKIGENLKIFALNSDVEKIWKETEGLKRYVDEKTKMADGLANSLRAWEARNMQLMEKEHDFDEKLRAFPELKMLEGRIRKMERAFLEFQKHFVAAQITEPIIME